MFLDNNPKAPPSERFKMVQEGRHFDVYTRTIHKRQVHFQSLG